MVMHQGRPVWLDDESTWPIEIRTLLERRFANLKAFERRRAAIDRVCERDLLTRFNPPANPHLAEFNAVLAELEVLLSRIALVGYHCTRLCADEIESIRAGGLRPLGKDLVTERIRQRLLRGELDQTLAEMLLNNNYSEDGHGAGERAGMTWFVFTRSLLSEEWGVDCLFGIWGGEAIYMPYGIDSDVAAKLRTIGTACIIEASVPVPDIKTWSVASKLLSVFLNPRGVRTNYEPEMDGHVRIPVGPSAIRRIVRRQDPEFEQLTRCSRWRAQLT